MRMVPVHALRGALFAALATLLSTQAAAKEYLVCVGYQHIENIEALIQAASMDEVALYARLHCWKIRPPARDPGTDDENWAPFPRPSTGLMFGWWEINPQNTE